MSECHPPTVSVVIAAYGRPEVLAWAVRSVIAQTFTDWEIIVVSDACPITTKAMRTDPQFAADVRIIVFELLRNVGEQSGPNNFGISQARGRYISFLNQDDLWFPDHLHLCLEALNITGAGIVFSLAGSMVPATEADLEAGRWIGGLNGQPRSGNFDPASTFAPASSWLLRREVVDAMGPWKSATECYIAPSQDFMYRAWRQGVRIRSCPELTLLTFSSGGRTDSYRTDLSHEQRWWFDSVGLDDRARAHLLRRLTYALPEHPLKGSRRLFRAIRQSALRVLARWGIEPLSVSYFFINRGRKGAYIEGLRRIRGLSALFDQGLWQNRVSCNAVERACDYRLGSIIDFSERGDAQRFQLEGWAYPEAWGTWTEGKQAALKLRIYEGADLDLQLFIELRAFIPSKGYSQKVRVSVNGVQCSDFEHTHSEFTSVQIRIPLEAINAGSAVILGFDLPNCVSPYNAVRVADHRQLALGVKSICLREA